MDYVLITRITLGSLYSILVIIRISFAFLDLKIEPNSDVKDNIPTLIVIQIYILSLIITVFTYIANPNWYNWGNIPKYSNVIIWIGLTLGILSLGLFISAHIYLGRNYSFFLRFQKDQKLVKTGPYRFVRHPIYTAYILFHIGIFLIVGNWFLGIIWIGGFCIIFVLRIRKEEKMLIETFGHEYLEYKERTGCIFPPVIKLLNKKKRRRILSSIKEKDSKEV